MRLEIGWWDEGFRNRELAREKKGGKWGVYECKLGGGARCIEKGESVDREQEEKKKNVECNRSISEKNVKTRCGKRPRKGKKGVDTQKGQGGQAEGEHTGGRVINFFKTMGPIDVPAELMKHASIRSACANGWKPGRERKSDHLKPERRERRKLSAVRNKKKTKTQSTLSIRTIYPA